MTFTAPRPAHVFAALTNGPTVIAPIGSPPEAIVSQLGLQLSTPLDFAPLLAPRAREGNKGKYGHVVVIGGSVGKAGAAAMAGFAALRAGAGLSTVATPKSVLSTVASYHPEVMTEPLAETEHGTISLRAVGLALDALLKLKTIAIGPGITRNSETAEFVRTVVTRGDKSLVVDADALNAFEGTADKLNGRGRTVVITPHPGEMSRLTGLTIAEIQANRLEVARKFAREHVLIVVLKGHRTLIAAPDGTVWVNPTGNPGMATGGTGDVLTGMVAGLIAQHPQQRPRSDRSRRLSPWTGRRPGPRCRRREFPRGDGPVALPASSIRADAKSKVGRSTHPRLVEFSRHFPASASASFLIPFSTASSPSSECL